MFVVEQLKGPGMNDQCHHDHQEARPASTAATNGITSCCDTIKLKQHL